MRNFRSFADILSQFPTGEEPTNVSLPPQVPQATMPDHLAMDAQDEALVQPTYTPAPSAPAPVQATQPAPKAPISRAPAMDDAPVAETPEKKQKNELGRLELLMQQMNEQRKAEIADAQSRQMKANMLKGLTDNIGLMVGGAQAMNTKAAVTPAQVKGFDPGDLTNAVDKKYAPEQAQLLAQYKELKDKNGELSEKDKAYLALGYKQLELGQQRAGDANNRFYEGEGNRMYKFGVQQDQKDEYSDKQTEDLKALDNTLNLLDGVEKEFSTGKYDKYLGPYASKYQNSKEYNPLSGGMDPEFAKFQSNITDSLSQYIKSLSGLTVSDTERANLLLAMPKVGDKPQTFKAKLEATKERIKALSSNNKSALAKYQGKTGKVASRDGSAQKTEAPKSNDKVRVSNGKETLEIDASDLADAEKDGYKKV